MGSVELAPRCRCNLSFIGRPVEPATPLAKYVPEGKIPAGTEDVGIPAVMEDVGIPAAMADVALDLGPSGPGWCQLSNSGGGGP